MIKKLKLASDVDVEFLSDGRHTIFNSAGIQYVVHGPKTCQRTRIGNLTDTCAIHNPTNHHMIHWPWYMFPKNGFLLMRMCRHWILHPDPDALAFITQGEYIGMDPMLAHFYDQNCDGCCLGEDT